MSLLVSLSADSKTLDLRSASFLKDLFLLYVHECSPVCMYVCVSSVFRVPTKARRQHWTLWTGGADGGEIPCGAGN